MNLHSNPSDFSELIRLASAHFKIVPAFIEKDYWITHVLKQLSNYQDANHVVFKGGTSLSKGYHLINRFSEDIDLAMMENNLSGNALKKKIRTVEKVITSDLSEIIIPGITSKGSMFRKALYEYPAVIQNKIDITVPSRIIIEINSFANPYPFVKQTIISFIANYLELMGHGDLLEMYDLNSFSLNVLDKKRTMVEKIVSLVRFSFSSDAVKSISTKIRHFYDLYYLANDSECQEYIQSEDFKTDFLKLFIHDQQTFDTPKDWENKKFEDSPLLRDFSALWSRLRFNYQNELNALAFTAIPDEKDVEKVVHDLLYSLL